MFFSSDRHNEGSTHHRKRRYRFELDEEKFCLISPPGTILLNLYITEEPLESLLISKHLKQ